MAGRAPITVRARVYLAIAGGRSAVMVAWAAIWPADQWARADLPLLSTIPLAVWGGVFAIHALLALLAGATGNETAARHALLVGATITAVWAAGLSIGWLAGDGVGWMVLAVTWTALALKDLVVCGMPLRSPLDALAAKVAER